MNNKDMLYYYWAEGYTNEECEHLHFNEHPRPTPDQVRTTFEYLKVKMREEFIERLKEQRNEQTPN